MKLSPQDEKLMEVMAPGVLCREGFLGSDTRPLGEILDTDRSTVEGLAVTHGQLACGLTGILTAAMSEMGRPVEIDAAGRLRVVYRESMGRMPCPWGDGLFAKGEVELTDQQTGQKTVFTPLSVHMIARHGFYQGRGSCYRLEPADLVRSIGETMF